MGGGWGGDGEDRRGLSALRFLLQADLSAPALGRERVTSAVGVGVCVFVRWRRAARHSPDTE